MINNVFTKTDFKAHTFYNGNSSFLDSQKPILPTRTAHGNRETEKSPDIDNQVDSISYDRNIATTGKKTEMRKTLAISFMNKRQ